MKTLFCFSVLALCLPIFSQASPGISGSEQVIRNAISKLGGGVRRGQYTKYLYRGQNASGKKCDANLVFTLPYLYNPNANNGYSWVQATIEDKWVGFDGEGAIDSDATVAFAFNQNQAQLTDIRSASGSKLQLTYRDSTFNAHALSSIASTQATCGNLRFAVALNTSNTAQIQSVIRQKLDKGQKLGLFNDCHLGYLETRLICGYSIDDTNEQQGSITFQINANGSLAFVSFEKPNDF